VSGSVVAVNTELEKAPEQVNKDPYGKGWMVKIKLTQPADLASLLSPGAYKTQIGQ
jgi:glycine cleavage system H protein